MSQLTPQGLEVDRLEDILSAMYISAKMKFGEDINTDEDSVFTLLFSIVAEILSSNNEGLQGVYNAFDPDAAEGTSLDNACNLVGVKRLGDASSIIIAVVYGDPNTVIPLGAQAALQDTDDFYDAKDSVTLLPSTAVKVKITVSTVINSTLYQVIINGSTFGYTSDSSATNLEIAAGLVSAINGGTQPVTATDNIDGTFIVDATDFITPYDLAVGTNLTISKVGVLQTYTSNEAGPIPAEADSLIRIVTPIDGWDSIINPYDGVEGRSQEKDTQLRIRRNNSLQNPGVSTLDSIRSRVNQITGVVTALGRENVTLITDINGLPGKSFQIVAQGGDTQVIGQTIWDNKPAGIQSFGTTSVNIVDSSGFPQTVYFSRPAPIYVWVKVTYTLFDEETFPSDGVNAIAASVLATGNQSVVGMDVIPQRFVGPIYEAVSGIGNLLVEMATTTDPLVPPVSYSDAIVVIDIDELPLFDLTRITVIEA